MEAKENFKISKQQKEQRAKWSKKKVIIVVMIPVILGLVAGGIIFWPINRQEASGQADDRRQFIMGSMGEGMVSASGLTNVAMQEEAYQLDFLETALYVEESYLSVGDQVEKGTKVFKVSAETLEKAGRELENAVTETALARRQGKIDYQTGLLDASETLQLAEVNQKYAQAEYNSAAASAAAQVEKLEEQVQEAQELVDEYRNSVNNNYYYT